MQFYIVFYLFTISGVAFVNYRLFNVIFRIIFRPSDVQQINQLASYFSLFKPRLFQRLFEAELFILGNVTGFQFVFIPQPIFIPDSIEKIRRSCQKCLLFSVEYCV